MQFSPKERSKLLTIVLGGLIATTYLVLSHNQNFWMHDFFNTTWMVQVFLRMIPVSVAGYLVVKFMPGSFIYASGLLTSTLALGQEINYGLHDTWFGKARYVFDAFGLGIVIGVIIFVLLIPIFRR
jgi:hypothetical protein